MSLAAAAPVGLEVVEQPLVSVATALMGGSVGIHLRPTDDTSAAARQARAAAEATLRRIAAWADRLTRFTETSDLARLNAFPGTRVPVRPTLAACLDWSRQAEALSDGIVDVARLDARLAAERGGDPALAGFRGDRSWSLDRGGRTTYVRRAAGLRIDLDGVAKGWLADRALARLDRFHSAVVDADGDIAIRLGPADRWRFGVADPRATNTDLLELELVGEDRPGGSRFGLATSGTSIHRWEHDGGTTHHLIDPRTGRPAESDVIQATVLAATARGAEALAKTAVILGTSAAIDVLDHLDVGGAILLTDHDELITIGSISRWLA